MKNNNMMYTLMILLIVSVILFASCQKKNPGELDHGFSINEKGVLYNGNILPDVDANSFQVLDEHFAKDKFKAFYHNAYRESKDYFMSKKYQLIELPSADPTSFQSLGYGYAKDKSKVWFEANTFEVADISSIKTIDKNFVVDSKYVYINRSKMEDIQGASFSLIDAFYAKDGQRYFYMDNDQVSIKLRPISCDYATFTILDYHFSKDDKQVFYRGFPMKDAVPKTFKVLQFPYSSDGKMVFYRDVKVKEADAATFAIFKENENLIGSTYYAYDKNKVYRNEIWFKDVDRSTFSILNDKYCLDANGVYFGLNKIQGVDVKSFEVFPHYMGDADAKDKNYLYGDGKIVGKNNY